MQTKQRLYQFDNMKALLIFLVVLGHMISKFGDDTALETIYKMIFSFHMPAFIFVSGYFARINPKKILSFMFPLYIVFQLLRLFVDYLPERIQAGESIHFGLELFTPGWTLWYLAAMMIFQLLLPVFDTNNEYHRIAYLILAIALGVVIGWTPDTDNFMGLARVVYFLPFFLLGYYEHDGHYLKWMLREHWPILARVITAALAAVMIVIFVLQESHISVSLLFGKDPYDDPHAWAIRLMNYLIALVWICFLLVWIPEKRIPVIDRIGCNTLSIYLLHGFAITAMLSIPAVKSFITDNVAVIIVIAVGLTLALSWDFFEKMIRKIHLPYDPNRSRHYIMVEPRGQKKDETK